MQMHVGLDTRLHLRTGLSFTGAVHDKGSLPLRVRFCGSMSSDSEVAASKRAAGTMCVDSLQLVWPPTWHLLSASRSTFVHTVRKVAVRVTALVTWVLDAPTLFSCLVLDCSHHYGSRRSSHRCGGPSRSLAC